MDWIELLICVKFGFIFFCLHFSLVLSRRKNTSLGGAAAHWGAERCEAERRRGWSVSKRSLWCCTSESDFPALRGGVRGRNHGRWLKIAVLPSFFWGLLIHVYMYFFFYFPFFFFYLFIFTSNPESDCLSAPVVESLGWSCRRQLSGTEEVSLFPSRSGHQQRDSGVKSCLLKIRTSRRLATCWGEPCARNDCDQRRPFHDG